MRRGALVSLVLLLVVAAAGCGGSAPSQPPASLDGVAGHWSVTGDRLGSADFLLLVEQRDGTYHVSIDGGPLRPVEMADGRLVLPLEGPGSRSLEFGMDGERAAVFAYVSHGVNIEPGEPTGSFWAPFAAEPVAAAEYEKRAAAKADERMRLELLTMELALGEWTERHGGEPPAPAEVAEDAAFGRWMTTEMAAVEVPWPVNPYTGEAMHAGREPGDFSYARIGEGFTLTGVLHDGTTFISAWGPAE